MTTLRERLEAKTLEQIVITIRGERFTVVELDRAERARMFADCRDKQGKVKTELLEGTMLSRCVRDPDTDTEIYSAAEWEKWDAVGSGITGPLFAEVMRQNGLDNDDVGREIKNSDTTGS